MKEEALRLTEELNNEMFKRGGFEYYSPFEFKSCGWNNSAIYFMGIPLWTEDGDEREYITETDEKEALRSFVVREAKKILKDLNLKMGAL